MFQPIDVKSSNNRETTTSWNVAFYIGRESSESFAKAENLVDRYGDGVRSRHNSPIVLDGGIYEPGKNRGHNDSNWHK